MSIAGHGAVDAAATGDVVRVHSTLEGVEPAIYALAELLRGHQRAQVCAICVRDPATDDARLYRADEDPQRAAHGSRVEFNVQRLLLDPSEEPLVFNRRALRTRKAPVHAGARFVSREINAGQLAQLARLLEADAFVSLPLRGKQGFLGRVHLGYRRARYSGRAVESLVGLVGQAGAMIEDMRLAGRLALETATYERRRISRDLHDSTVQPYIGLKLGLEALRRKVKGTPDLEQELDELIAMAGDGIGELRQYVGKLKRTGMRPRNADWLLPAVRREAQKFTEFYRIETLVLSDKDIAVTAALQTEIIHLVREGLSNVRRHTSARQATIRMRQGDRRLFLEIINENTGPEAKRDFLPRSIGERAKELGGRLTVQRVDGHTLVGVELPI